MSFLCGCSLDPIDSCSPYASLNGVNAALAALTASCCVGTVPEGTEVVDILNVAFPTGTGSCCPFLLVTEEVTGKKYISTDDGTSWCEICNNIAVVEVPNGTYSAVSLPINTSDFPAHLQNVGDADLWIIKQPDGSTFIGVSPTVWCAACTSAPTTAYAQYSYFIAGTTGATINTGAWRTVPINTTDFGVAATGFSLNIGLSEITVPTGTWLVKGAAAIVRTGSGSTGSKTRLFNVTGAAELFRGLAAESSNTPLGNGLNILTGVLTIASPTVVRLEIGVQQTSLYYVDAAPTGDTNNRFAEISFQKLAD